jgi:hypothetical protein
MAAAPVSLLVAVGAVLSEIRMAKIPKAIMKIPRKTPSKIHVRIRQ